MKGMAGALGKFWKIQSCMSSSKEKKKLITIVEEN